MQLLDSPEYWKEQMLGNKDADYKYWNQSVKNILNDMTFIENALGKEFIAMEGATGRYRTTCSGLCRKIAVELQKSTGVEVSIDKLARLVEKHLDTMLKGANSQTAYQQKRLTLLLTKLKQAQWIKKPSEVERSIRKIQSLAQQIQDSSASYCARIETARVELAEKVIFEQEKVRLKETDFGSTVKNRTKDLKSLMDRVAGGNEAFRSYILRTFERYSRTGNQMYDLSKIGVEVAEITRPRAQLLIQENNEFTEKAKKSIEQFKEYTDGSKEEVTSFFDKLGKFCSEREAKIEKFFSSLEKSHRTIGSELIRNGVKIRQILREVSVDAGALVRAGDAASRAAITDRMITRAAVAQIYIDEAKRLENKTWSYSKSVNEKKAYLLKELSKRFHQFTDSDYARLVSRMDKDWEGALKQASGMLKYWEEHPKKVSGSMIKEFMAAVDKTRLGRRMFVLLYAREYLSYDELISAMKKGSFSAAELLNERGLRIGDYAPYRRYVFDLFKGFNADLLAELNGKGIPEYALIGDDLNKQLEKIKSFQEAEIEAIRSKVRYANGFKLAKEAPEEFAKCVRREANRIKTVENDVKRATERVSRKFFDNFRQPGTSEWQKAARGIVIEAREFAYLIRDTLAELVDYGIAEEKIPENIKPRLKDLVGKALKLGGWLVEGFVIGLVVDEIVEAMEKFFVKILTRIVAKHKTLQDLLAYKVFCDVTVEKIGYNIWSTDVNLREVFVVLIFRLIGLAIAESSKENPAFAELIAATMKNNPDSLLSHIVREEKKLTGIALNASENKTVVLYNGSLASSKSHCIFHVAYNANTERLYIGFNDKKKTVYEYAGVPMREIQAMAIVGLNAKSLGIFFNYNIRPKYKEFRRFEAPLEAAVGEKGKIEKPAQVKKNVKVVDEQVDIQRAVGESTADFARRIKEMENQRARGYAFLKHYLDYQGKLHFVYYDY